MRIFDRRGLKETAAASLQDSRPNYRKLVLLHGAVSACAALVLAIVNAVLDSGISSTGGLSGMGMRSVLSTVQFLLMMVMPILLPFWDLGILWTSIRVARHQNTDVSMLTRGFRRYSPVLRLMLLRLGIFMLAAVVCSYLASLATSFMPMPDTLEQALLALEEETLMDPIAMLEQLPADVLTAYFRPIVIVAMVLYLGVCLFLHYWLRFADYVVLDEAPAGPIDALRISSRMTIKRLWQLVKLDLSLWWYYALQVLLLAVAYADWILPALGVTLPMSRDVAYWVFYGLSFAGNLALCWFAAPYYQVIYATAYDWLRE